MSDSTTPLTDDQKWEAVARAARREWEEVAGLVSIPGSVKDRAAFGAAVMTAIELGLAGPPPEHFIRSVSTHFFALNTNKQMGKTRGDWWQPQVDRHIGDLLCEGKELISVQIITCKQESQSGYELMIVARKANA